MVVGHNSPEFATSPAASTATHRVLDLASAASSLAGTPTLPRHLLVKAARVLALMAPALAGCGPILTHGTPLAAVLAADQAQAAGPYRLQSGDQIEVHHILDPDYSAVLTVAPDGAINVPGIRQSVAARGQTVLGLHGAVEPAVSDRTTCWRDPFFSLNLRAFGSLQVFVGGEVQRPGYLELSGGDRRVLQVITSGGGFLPTARQRTRSIILRTRTDGTQQIFSVDLSEGGERGGPVAERAHPPAGRGRWCRGPTSPRWTCGWTSTSARPSRSRRPRR